MRTSTIVATLFALSLGCTAKPSPTTDPEPDAAAPSDEAQTEAPAGDTARGGQLFDKWWALSEGFEPDDDASAEPDGSGGPNGDGTLNRAGAPMLNAGHDYRLKNLFGWDLRGEAGIYGPSYQNKANVVAVDLLADTRSVDELVAWLGAGDENVPALAEVLSPEQLRDLASFIVAVRERELAHPDEIWALSTTAPNNYELVPGADLTAGAELVASKCAGCHGADGSSIIIDEHYTLGAYARSKAYEAWIKILNGQPGSPMGRQSTEAAEILNILAALCDRTAFPAKDADHEVPDGDARCGAYLK